MKHYLIGTLEPNEIQEVVEWAIKEGRMYGPDPDRKCAEMLLRGWCEDRTTQSFREALIIFLHNHIVK